MGSIAILIVAVVAALFDTTWTGSDTAPRLTLALVGWLTVTHAPGLRVWILAWLCGLIHDAADPGSHFFHALFALFACALGQGLRAWVFPQALLSTVLVTAVVVVAEAVVAAVFVNAGGWLGWRLLFPVLSTAAVAWLLAWMMRPWFVRRMT